MKIASARYLGKMPVFDLSVDHEHHSFVHESGVVVHNCGYVIANRPIHEFIPTTIISETICTAYTPASVEAVGGVKMDFLVINSLKDLGACIKLIQARHGAAPAEGKTVNGKWVPQCRLLTDPKTKELVDIWDLPADQKVFRDVALGRTETVFQFNTPGAIQWLRHFGHKRKDGLYPIDSIEAMAAFTALDRPGPLDAFVTTPGFAPQKRTENTVILDSPNPVDVVKPRKGEIQKEAVGQHNMLVEYARRARGEDPSEDIFPFFDDLFPETYGVMVYQEQLQFAYQYLTGCTGPEAEEFRRNIAKKKMEKVLGAYPNFIAKATEKLGSSEDAERCWEFFKTWGQYGFNKSHAVCYSIIGYACAYLKHHYPLEWWTSVLRNATKDEINEKFWKYCGHLINLPDVTKSRETFEIVDGRIQAPLSLLHGVGEKAHKQLVDGVPYANIDDFCTRIQAFKEKGATFSTKVEKKEKKNKKTGEVTVLEKEVVKKKLGSSALNRGIIYTLIVSGSMDSLFAEGMTTLEMLGNFEAAMEKLGGKVDSKRLNKYIDIDQLTRYQMRKSILPAYSTDLTRYFLELRIPGVLKDLKRVSYQWKQLLPFASITDLERLDTITPFPDDPLKVAVAAYVEGQRFFSYGEGKSNDAVDFTLEVDGIRKKFVKWGRRETGKLPEQYKKNYNGAIVIAILSKYKENKPWTLEELITIQEPLGQDQESSPESEESK